MDHKKILEKIKEIEDFFTYIGLKKVQDFPKNWDLDSFIKFKPIQDNYIINYKGEDRVLMSASVYIVGGLHFVMSGKMGVSVYETVKTNYDLSASYDDAQFFKTELRDWKLKKFLN